MLKLILKNLWARRVRNAWLLAELILITVLTWYITDPVFVLSYNQSLPLGYEPKGLLIAPLSHLPSNASGYSEEEADLSHVKENMDRLLRKLRDYPGVQSATPLTTFAFPGSGGSSTTMLKYDTLSYPVSVFEFIPHSDFFKTMEVKPLEGKTLEELDNMEYQERDLLIAGGWVHLPVKGDRLTGQHFYNNRDGDTTFLPIKAVVEKVRSRDFGQGTLSCFRPQLNVRLEDILEDGVFLIRLRPDISEQRFLHEFRPWAHKNLRAGNLYLRDIQTYQEHLKELEYESGVTNKYRMNIGLAIFFLVNLALGVTGTFWLQTRSRREEVGIMLSYGASPGHICRLLMGEGAVLASFAWLVGCLIYLQYGIASGSWYRIDDEQVAFYWINDFWLHYVAVSLIVYIIIISVVLLGVYIPASRLSHIPPTEALHDE